MSKLFVHFYLEKLLISLRYKNEFLVCSKKIISRKPESMKKKLYVFISMMTSITNDYDIW